jgi:Xaa-Pro aminopeptidase
MATAAGANIGIRCFEIAIALYFDKEVVMSLFAQRRQKLAALTFNDRLDWMLVSHPVNVSYLTNFSGEASWLLVGRDRAVLVSDGRFTEQIAEECSDLDTAIRPPSKPLVDAVGETLAKLGGKAVGYESAHLTVADFEALQTAAPTINFKACKDRVEGLRAIKDESEVAQIREAIHIAERAFAMFRAMLEPDQDEKELADAMEMFVRRAGGRCTSFPSIVAVGSRAALPHAPPTGRRVSEAELLLVDWGASGRFYKSDLTRVLATRKNPTLLNASKDAPRDGKLEEVYNIVLRAQRAALEAIRPGATGGSVDAAARRTIAEAGYGDFFNHSIGHGLGMQVHEMPMMRQGTTQVLQAGMVVTVEPGIYLPNWGGVRIEDDVLILPDGIEILTRVPKELAAMAVEW